MLWLAAQTKLADSKWATEWRPHKGHRVRCCAQTNKRAGTHLFVCVCAMRSVYYLYFFESLLYCVWSRHTTTNTKSITAIRMTPENSSTGHREVEAIKR